MTTIDLRTYPGALTTRDGRPARYLGELVGTSFLVFAVMDDTGKEIAAYRYRDGRIHDGGTDYPTDIIPAPAPKVKRTGYSYIVRGGDMMFVSNIIYDTPESASAAAPPAGYAIATITWEEPA